MTWVVVMSVRHLRTKGGRHEVDLIVERDDHRIMAIEVKLLLESHGLRAVLLDLLHHRFDLVLSVDDMDTSPLTPFARTTETSRERFSASHG